MQKFYGVYFFDAHNDTLALCEVDGGICYDAHRTEAEARASLKPGDSKYTVKLIPAGTRVWDNVANREAMSG